MDELRTPRGARLLVTLLSLSLPPILASQRHLHSTTNQVDQVATQISSLALGTNYTTVKMKTIATMTEWEALMETSKEKLVVVDFTATW